jgi:hypothetical protein
MKPAFLRNAPAVTTLDERMIEKACICMSIFDDERLFVKDCVSAERTMARRLCQSQSQPWFQL